MSYIFLYSLIKNKANPMDLYSTLYPATYSLSASGKSIGARFYSAKQQITQRMTIGQSAQKKKPFS
jgi:hypothetical protein